MFKKILIFAIVLGVTIAPCSFNFLPDNVVMGATEISYTHITADMTWGIENSPYIITDNLYVDLGVTLTIDPGVIIKLKRKGIWVVGKIIANGNSNEPIIFTSINDDLRGGQSDTSNGNPQNGDWLNIAAYSGGEIIFNNVVVNYGGLEEYILVRNNKIIKQNSALADFSPVGAIRAFGGKVEINNSKIYNNIIGLESSDYYVDSNNYTAGILSIHNSEIYNNDQAGLNNWGSNQVDAINNWWGSNSGPYNVNSNPNGQGNAVSDNVLFDPWIGKNCNHVPAIELLAQYRSDSETVLEEESTTAGNIIFFKAKVNDEDNDPVRIEVELKEFPDIFFGDSTLFSQYTVAGSEAVLQVSDLENGEYHWRARAVDEGGAVSPWAYFGASGVYDTNYDFKIKTVPLYTQVRSNYPSDEETRIWSVENYAFGGSEYSCAYGREAKIADCGCAITSMVMLGRYYEINHGINSTNSDPLEINNWLENNSGYINGNLYWSKGIEYLGFIDGGVKKIRLSLDHYNTRPATQGQLIDNYILASKPAVAFSNTFGHYFVIDNKIKVADSDFTYGIKDPVWYNTKTLNQNRNIPGKIQNYHNTFTKANLFSYLEVPKKIAASLDIRLASPAELLIIDPQGRKLGLDPVSGLSYNEIPGGIYTDEEDIISSETELDVNNLHKTKVIHIEEPVGGKYDINVIGTGNGNYNLSLLAYDNNGDSTADSKNNSITVGTTQEYNLNFDSENASDTTMKIKDEMPPEANIYFDKETDNLVIKGVDNITVDPLVSEVENCLFKIFSKCLAKEYIYTISDSASNTLRIWIDKNKNNQSIIASIKKMQYNDSEAQKINTRIIYVWSEDKKNGDIKFLSQTINNPKNFFLEALYKRVDNKTKIVGYDWEGKQSLKEEKEGLTIIKLITEQGELKYEY